MLQVLVDGPSTGVKRQQISVDVLHGSPIHRLLVSI